LFLSDPFYYETYSPISFKNETTSKDEMTKCKDTEGIGRCLFQISSNYLPGRYEENNRRLRQGPSFCHPSTSHPIFESSWRNRRKNNGNEREEIRVSRCFSQTGIISVATAGDVQFLTDDDATQEFTVRSHCFVSRWRTGIITGQPGAFLSELYRNRTVFLCLFNLTSKLGTQKKTRVWRQRNGN